MEDETRPPIAVLAGSVLRRERPILLVVHAGNGDWQFLDGDDVVPGDLAVVHVHHVFDEHPDVRPLRDLPLEWAAERGALAQPSVRCGRPADAADGFLPMGML